MKINPWVALVSAGILSLFLFQNCGNLNSLQSTQETQNTQQNTPDQSADFSADLMNKIDVTSFCERWVLKASGEQVCEKIDDTSKSGLNQALVVLQHKDSSGRFTAVVHASGKVLLINRNTGAVLLTQLSEDKIKLITGVIDAIGEKLKELSTEIACIADNESSSGAVDLISANQTKIVLNKKGQAKLIYLRDCNIHTFIYAPNTAEFNSQLQDVISTVLAFIELKAIAPISPPVEGPVCMTTNRMIPVCEESQEIVCTSVSIENRCSYETCTCRNKKPIICPIPMIAIRACKPDEEPQMIEVNSGNSECHYSYPSCDKARSLDSSSAVTQ